MRGDYRSAGGIVQRGCWPAQLVLESLQRLRGMASACRLEDMPVRLEFADDIFENGLLSV